MTAPITVTRRDKRNEDVHFEVDVTRDKDGDIWSTVAEDVPDRRTTTRYGSVETYQTGGHLYRQGEPIKLSEEEIAEAKEAIVQIEAFYRSEINQLKEDLRLKFA